MAAGPTLTCVPAPLARLLGAGALGLVVHAVLETGTLPQSFLYDAIGASAVVAGAGRRPAPPPGAQAAVAAHGRRPGACSWPATCIWNWYEMIGEEPFPSIADVAVPRRLPVHRRSACFLLIRRRAGRRRPRRPARRRDPDDRPSRSCPGRSSSSRRSVGADLDPLSLAISLAYPLARPAPHRRRDGPAHDAGRADDVVPAARREPASCCSSPTRSTRSRTSTARTSSGGPIDTLYLIAYLLFGAAGAAPVDASAHRSAARRRSRGSARCAWSASPLAMVTGPILVTLGPEGPAASRSSPVATAILSCSS